MPPLHSLLLRLFCKSDPAIPLTANPTGGTWTGAGVVSGSPAMFDPGIADTGKHYLKYTVAIGGTCTIVDSVLMTVVTLMGLTAGPDESACVNDLPFNLSGNNFPGGSWSGTGITDPLNGTFDPSLTTTDTTIISYAATDARGCIDTATKKVIVLQTPGVTLSTIDDTVCIGDSIWFSVTASTIDSVKWDFGDGNTSTKDSLNHAYNASGTYTMRVQVFGNLGCASNSQKTIFVRTVPDVDIAVNPNRGCGDQIVDLTTTLNNPSEVGTGLVYNWDLGNGTTAQIANPTGILYTQGAVEDTAYYPILTIRNACGNDIERDTVTIERAPIAFFGIQDDEICPLDSAVFLNGSSSNATSWLWNFGNGNMSTDRFPPKQKYPELNNDQVYPITLTVSNDCGDSTYTQNLKVLGKTVQAGFKIEPSNGCAPLTVDLISLATSGSDLVWYIDTLGVVINQDTIKDFVFNTAGTYDISHKANNGCSEDSTFNNLVVLASPTALFTSDKTRACTNEVVNFTNNSSADAVSFVWNFGDGLSSFGQNTNHAYINANLYEVQLIATNANNCADTAVEFIEILETPIASFVPDTNTICANIPLGLTNNSTNANDFIWYFGDGTTSQGFSPSKSYSTDGLYFISLVAFNSESCMDSIRQTVPIRVLESPIADFDYTQTRVDNVQGIVDFSNLSMGAIAPFYWSFGDGNTSTEDSPQNIYDDNGLKRVVLAVENALGCKDTITKDILIEFFGDLFIPTALTPSVGGSDASLFKPKGYGIEEYKIEVYSTYGELLWSSNELVDGQPIGSWDGTYKGVPMPQDVYVWKASAILTNGSVWPGIDDGKGKKTTVGAFYLLR